MPAPRLELRGVSKTYTNGGQPVVTWARRGRRYPARVAARLNPIDVVHEE